MTLLNHERVLKSLNYAGLGVLHGFDEVAAVLVTVVWDPKIDSDNLPFGLTLFKNQGGKTLTDLLNCLKQANKLTTNLSQSVEEASKGYKKLEELKKDCDTLKAMLSQAQQQLLRQGAPVHGNVQPALPEGNHETQTP